MRLTIDIIIDKILLFSVLSSSELINRDKKNNISKNCRNINEWMMDPESDSDPDADPEPDPDPGSGLWCILSFVWVVFMAC